MKLWNLLIPIVVAVVAAGGVFLLAGEQNSELDAKVKLLEGNLEQTRQEVAHAKEQLAQSQTADLGAEFNELSAALWAKIEDLDRQVATLEAQTKELAERPAPGQPGLAQNPDDPDRGPNERRTMRGLGKDMGNLVRGFQSRMTDRQVKRYTKELNLTESQVMDMKKALSEHSKKLMESFSKRMSDPEEGRNPADIYKELMAERDEELKRVLTPEQYEKFKELEKKRGGMFDRMVVPGRRPGGGSGREGEK